MNLTRQLGVNRSNYQTSDRLLKNFNLFLQYLQQLHLTPDKVPLLVTTTKKLAHSWEMSTA